jgi:REP element-mobilizing transposase RayT
MKYFNPKLHHRRSIRLKKFDYSQAGLYFITLCCEGRAHLFGEVKQGLMHLNSYGRIAAQEWGKTLEIRSNCRLHVSVIMPNHIHGIIEITYSQNLKNTPGEFLSPSHTIGSIIRGFKISTIKRIKDFIHESTGESQFAPINRLQFAPINRLQFAPINRSQFAPINRLQFAPINRLQFAPINRSQFTSSNELQFTPGNTPKMSELQFAPTRITEKIKSLNYRIWQRNYYEHIIRDEKSYNNISNYILNNPQNWKGK